jgi:hypothetical protein
MMRKGGPKPPSASSFFRSFIICYSVLQRVNSSHFLQNRKCKIRVRAQNVCTRRWLVVKKITAAQLKNQTSQAIAAAQNEPVSIEVSGQIVAVMIAQSDFERFTRFENDYWLTRIQRAEKIGYLGTKATANFIRNQ